jgi:hypothetical protein
MSIARSDALFERLGIAQGMSPEAIAWLKIILDPMHDTLVDFKGLPDGKTGAMIPELVKISMTVKAPANITGSTLWDCNIFNSPIVANTPVSQATSLGTITTNGWQYSNNSTQPFGGLTAIAVTSGADCSYLSVAAAGNASNAYVQNLVPDPRFLDGKVRVTASGHEITNVTNELAVQGTATVWRSPVQDYESASAGLVVQSSTSNIGFPSLAVVEAAPTTVAQALLLPGSRQWAAKEGSYQAHAYHNVTNIPTEEYNNVQPVYIERGSNGALTPFIPQSISQALVGINNSVTTSGSGVIATGAIIDKFAYYSATTWTKADMSGTFFTGLSASTVLNCTYNILIERYPDNNEVVLLPLAKPSPCLDIAALTAYTRALAKLPVGVMQKDNGLGEWFRETVQELAPYVAYGARAIGQFSGDTRIKALAGAVGTAANLATGFLGPPGSGKLRGTTVPSRSSNSSQSNRRGPKLPPMVIEEIVEKPKKRPPQKQKQKYVPRYSPQELHRIATMVKKYGE